MLSSLRKYFKWSFVKSSGYTKKQTSLIMSACIGILEDVLFWRKMWLSLVFILVFNVIFFVCVHRQVNIVEFIFFLTIMLVGVDGFEAWLKYKHRDTCLRKLATHEGPKINLAAVQLNQWIETKCNEYIYLRKTNHTKAFLLMNICLGMVFFTGKYVNGYLLMYLLVMTVCLYYKVIFPLLKLLTNIRQDLESDGELEGLIPEASEVDIKLLSIEPEHTQPIEDKQSFDYWKPEDIPLAECSDSSDNSSSLVTNFSMEKMQSLEKDVETSDTSDDEYIPIDQQKQQMQTTLEVQESVGSWSSAAYNALWNMTGVVANLMQTQNKDSNRKRLPSKDSSDGFEMIDQHDLS